MGGRCKKKVVKEDYDDYEEDDELKDFTCYNDDDHKNKVRNTNSRI